MPQRLHALSFCSELTLPAWHATPELPAHSTFFDSGFGGLPSPAMPRCLSSSLPGESRPTWLPWVSFILCPLYGVLGPTFLWTSYVRGYCGPHHHGPLRLVCSLCASAEAPVRSQDRGPPRPTLLGIPKDIVSDRGPQFTSRVWGFFCSALRASVSLSSDYHPQSNGQTERMNQSLGNALCCVAALHPSAWSAFLPWVEYPQNSLVSSSSGFSPLMVGMGNQPPLFYYQEREAAVPSVQTPLPKNLSPHNESGTPCSRPSPEHGVPEAVGPFEVDRVVNLAVVGLRLPASTPPSMSPVSNLWWSRTFPPS